MQLIHEMPFGAEFSQDGLCKFSLWAPAVKSVGLRLNSHLLPMRDSGDGWWGIEVEAQPGDPYAFRIDDRVDVPDPASRRQAQDVHGPSLVVDPRAFEWSDGDWRGRAWHEAVIYELHIGTFTASGTFIGAIDRLDYLVGLGITAVELMPVADFPGRRDWGYDGVLLFSPDRRYGTPEELKTFIAAAHERGLMVLLDVVYNHFGPEGNYLHLYAPDFFTERHHSPWGAGINFDGEKSRVVRDFFIHNALYWIEEFHFDGLRFDAVHAIQDDSHPDILRELATMVRSRVRGREIHLVLENDNNAARYLRPGAGFFTAQWNDDFHHAIHVIATGEEGGYYEDFSVSPHALLARSLSEGFAFQGEYSAYRGRPRGESSRDLPFTSFVNFLQNHDQVGNRALGERLTALSSPEALRAVTAILLIAPAPPLIFMGQEWGSDKPFPFFCDFGPELAHKVSEGRRREFARFLEFSEAAQRARIPDPQSEATFRSAKLGWEEGNVQGEWLDLHRTLLDVRHREIIPRLRDARGRDAKAAVLAETLIVARWQLGESMLWLLANLGDEPVSDVVLSSQQLIYGTPDVLTENGTLAGWGVAYCLSEATELAVLISGQPAL